MWLSQSQSIHRQYYKIINDVKRTSNSEFKIYKILVEHIATEEIRGLYFLELL